MTVRVLDFRVRLGAGDGATQHLLTTMDTYGIDAAAVTAGGVLPMECLAANIIYGGGAEVQPDNERVVAACATASTRLVPIYFANPHADPDRYRDEGSRFRGVELSPAVHGVGLDDPRTEAIVRIAAELGHSVYVVCLGRPGTRSTDLVALARRFAEVDFVLGHGGFLGIDAHAINQVMPCGNILVETSGCFTALARYAIARLGPERVLFGTEFPLQHPSVELAKYTALTLTRPVWEQIAWHNARRVLRLAPSTFRKDPA